MLKALRIIAASAAISFRIPPKLRVCEWLTRNIIIPAVTGAVEPGPLDTSRVPPMEGLYDIIALRHVHFFTLAKSARVGGTLFAIGLVCHKISENPGPILWVDPTRTSARQLFRRELEPFLLACKPVGSQAFQDKEHWTASLCFFKGGSFLKMAGAGSPNELAGFQAELAIINEGDKVHHTTKGEAPPHELAIVRTKQFRHTRKVVENSTPTDEFGPTWKRFLKGTQRHCYVPCPHCKAMQRLTFSPEEKEVPFEQPEFDEAAYRTLHITNPPALPKGTTRIEKTGGFAFDHCRLTQRREVEPGVWENVTLGWDYDRVLAETQYRCVAGCLIDHTDLNWMLRRYRWIAHNSKSDKAHESAHFWAAFSPFEHWGEIAKKFLLAMGDQGAMHDVWNNDFGLPFKALATEVDEDDIQRLVKASPEYTLRTLPFRPIALTITVDVQKQGSANPFWWMIFAWGIAWDEPGWPTVAALVDYGPAASWEVIEELAAIRPLIKRRPEDPDRYHEYGWRNPDTQEVEKFRVLNGLVDSGDQAQSEAEVYAFCLRNRDIFNPSKGGSRSHCGGNRTRLSPVYEGKLQLLWYWSDVFCQTLYQRIIKQRKIRRLLPIDLGPEFFDQLTDEHTVEKNGRLKWEARRRNNHLGDCWKLQEVLGGDIEGHFDILRAERLADQELIATRIRALTLDQ